MLQQLSNLAGRKNFILVAEQTNFSYVFHLPKVKIFIGKDKLFVISLNVATFLLPIVPQVQSSS
jgi:hypothetical protein